MLSTVRVCIPALLLASSFLLSAQAADCPSGDLTGDCALDVEDLWVLADGWLGDSSNPADLNHIDGVNMVDFGLFAAEWLTDKRPITLVINEFMADNNGFVLDNVGDDDDWIEIYNYGDKPIDIGGMHLTDNTAAPKRWPVPTGAPDDTTIPARGFLVIWADNEGGEGGEGPLHASFALSRGGDEDVGLYDSDGNPVDVIENFPAQAENHSFGRFPDNGNEWRVFGSSVGSTPTPGESNGRIADEHIVINEIMYNPLDPADPPRENIGAEYIELFNTGAAEVDVSGWQLTGGVEFAVPTATSIPAAGYLVVAADETTFNTVYTGTDNLVAGWTGRLSNKGETIRLLNARGRVIDVVRYSDEGDWGVRRLGPVDRNHRGWMWSNEHDAGGKSLELISAHMPNEYGQNWGSSLTNNGTPGFANTATGAEGQTVLLVYSGATWHYLDDGSDQGAEADGIDWFGHPDYDDSGWASGPAELGYGDSGNGRPEATVVDYGGDSSNKYITTYFRHRFDAPDASKFTGATVRILRDDGAVMYLNGQEIARSNMPNGDIDYLTRASSNIYGDLPETEFHEYAVDPALFKPVGNVLAVEIHQVQPSSADISFDLILEALREPDASPATNDIAPLILDVKHAPIIPHSTDDVTVTAKILDELDSPSTVQLYHRIDTSSFNSAQRNIYPHYNPADYDVVVMYDDGYHGDGAAADGVYGGAIPATEEDGAVVEFFVEATDTAGNVRTWPAPSIIDGVPEQVTNCLYQTDDSFAPAEAWAPGDLPTYRIIMTEGERARLAYIGSSGDRNSNAQMNATFISIDGTDIRVRYNTGVRNRGHGTRSNRPNNHRVNFVHDRPWKGVSEININARDPHIQNVGAAVFQMAGIAAADAGAVGVLVNGQDLSTGSMYGSYVHVEVMNSDWAAEHLPLDSNGNVYKCMRDNGPDPADFRYLTNPDRYEAPYAKQTNERDADWSDVIELSRVLSTAPDETYVEDVKRVLDTEQWLRFLALMALLANNETSIAIGYGDDYYLYRGINDPRFILVPYDLDSIFNRGSSTTSSIWRATGIASMNRFMYHPEFLPRYYYHLNDLIETVLSPEQIDRIIDTALGEYVSASQIQTMKSFVANRNTYVLGLIERDFTINVNLSQSQGYYRTDKNTTSISGTADAIATRAVRVNGALADWSPRDGAWSIGEGSTGVGTMLIRRGSIWDYLDNGTDQGTAWKEPGFVIDADWSSGPAELGYGDIQATEVESGPSNDKYVTTYFRHEFELTEPPNFSSVRFGVLRDDGAVVYINGVEVARSNMPGSVGDNNIDYLTSARNSVGGSGETLFYGDDSASDAVDPSLLVQGTNVVAVEIHQYVGSTGKVTSSDISFDFELEAFEPGDNQGGTALLPGITRLFVETFGDPNGQGIVLQQGFVDVWYDDGSEETLSGVLSSDMTLTATEGPWRVTGDLTVPAGITLTIEPGTTLFFDAGRRLIVNGRLVAEATPSRHIRLTSTPGSTGWGGISFEYPLETPPRPTPQRDDNRISYADIEYCDGGASAIRAIRANVYLDHIVWANHTKQYLDAGDSSIILSHSTLPTLPSGELVHYRGLPADGYGLIEHNVFGSSGAGSDIVNFTGGKQPGPVARFMYNVFEGGSDDAIDLNGADAHVEGNTFVGIHQDTPGQDLSHAISAAQDAGVSSDITAVRNLFYDVDHAFLIADSGFGAIVNNTVVGATQAAINFFEDRSGRWPADGAWCDGNIFYDATDNFANLNAQGTVTDLTVHHSIMTGTAPWPGIGNSVADPLLTNTTSVSDPTNDFALLPGSPAKGTGPNGLDMGALVPGGASIAGGPHTTTHRTTAAFTIGGPGIIAYQYRLTDNGAWADAWSSVVYIADNPQIILAGLADGHTYTLHVIGTDSAGARQDPDEAATWTWSIDTSYRRLIINEVLAINNTAVPYNAGFPDAVELFYDGPGEIDLGGMSISDDPDEPFRHVFSSGTTIEPGQLLVLYCDPNAVGAGYVKLALDGDGDGVYLFDKPADGGGLVDSVEFGSQLPDISIGRLSDDRWRLTFATLGGPNRAYPLDDPHNLKINEWYTAGDGDDFIELFNPGFNPVDLSDLYLTDNPVNQPTRDRLGPLSFVGACDFICFRADGRTSPGHVDFRLSSDQEIIGLFDADVQPIDQLIYYWQTANVSQGRVPDGGDTLEFFQTPTPGATNRETIVINEVLAHSHALDPDWIELYNTTTEPVDISGWFLSDSGNDLRKYEIPDGTVVDPNRYVVFYENTHFGNTDAEGCRTPFGFSENGDTVYLSSGRNGQPTEYRISEDFGASETNVSLGRYQKSTGTFNFVAMSSQTPDAPNADPKVYSIVISEIMYHPQGDAGAEYVELLNRSQLHVPLYDADTGNLWKFTDAGDDGGIEFAIYDNDLDAPVVMTPNERIILTRDKAAFAIEFPNTPSGTRIYAWGVGALSNAGEKIQLSKPGEPDPGGDPYWIRIDRVVYSDGAHPLGQDPWPDEADGEGMSLTRVAPSEYGNDVINWTAADPTPGE